METMKFVNMLTKKHKLNAADLGPWVNISAGAKRGIEAGPKPKNIKNTTINPIKKQLTNSLDM